MFMSYNVRGIPDHPPFTIAKQVLENRMIKWDVALDQDGYIIISLMEGAVLAFLQEGADSKGYPIQLKCGRYELTLFVNLQFMN